MVDVDDDDDGDADENCDADDDDLKKVSEKVPYHRKRCLITYRASSINPLPSKRKRKWFYKADMVLQSG